MLVDRLLNSGIMSQITIGPLFVGTTSKTCLAVFLMHLLPPLLMIGLQCALSMTASLLLPEYRPHPALLSMLRVLIRILELLLFPILEQFYLITGLCVLLPSRIDM